MSHDPFPPDQLLARTEWLRRLARHLVDDPRDADDVVQDTMVAALRQPAGSVRNWRGWLSRVLRRMAHRQRQEEASRRSREAEAARSRSATSRHAVDDIVAQAALQRRVVGHVLDMAEPYRSTILLRYWEDLPPKQVAAKLGVPLDTVYARLRRGLARLRERLEHEEAGWRALMILFASVMMIPHGILSEGQAVGREPYLPISRCSKSWNSLSKPVHSCVV